MTPDQDAAIKRAEALARAQEEADAETNAAAGITDAPSDFAGASKEFVRSAGEGFTGLADLPERTWTGAKNLPKRLQNLPASQTVSPYTQGFVPASVSTNAPVPVKLEEPWTPVNDAYNSYFPPDPNFPTARKIGNIAGATLPAIVAPALLTGGVGALPGALLDTAVTTGTTYAGGQGGRAIDQAFGGSGDTGEFFGSALGSLTVPPVISARYNLLNRRYTDASTPGKVADAEAAGVPLSLGLVGNKRAAVTEDSTAGVPNAGNRAADIRRAQYTAFDQGLLDTANARRGGPAQGDIASKGDIGARVQNVAQQADANIRTGQNAVFDPISTAVGRDTVLDPTSQIQALDDLRRGSEITTQRPTVDYFRESLDASRFDPLNAPRVVDPTLEASLQGQLTRAQNNLASAQPGSPLHTAAQQSVADLTDAINANRGPTWQDQLVQRSVGSRRIDTGQALDARTRLGVKDAQTQTLQEGAQNAGISPQDFTAANEEYGRLADQRDFTRRLAEQDTGSAYNSVFSPASAQQADPLAILNEHAPSPLAQVMADNLELRARGSSAGDQAPNPETIRPRDASNWWNGMPEDTKTLYAGAPGTAERDRFEALIRTMQADATRPTRTIPTGGNTMGAPSAFWQNPSLLSNTAIPAAAAFTGTGSTSAMGVAGLFGALKAAAPSLRARYTASRFTDPNFVRRVVDPPGPLNPSDLARLMAASTSNNGQRQ